ncbi:MAG: hypothetical protein ACLPYS_10355 [Vulcanimicrobiaceae bacterium]|jgi:hypothetical protein
MVTIETTADELIVRPQGLHRFLAFASEVRVPLAHVVSAARAEEEAGGWFHGIRLPGTNIPGIVTAGTFRDSDGKTFWDVSDPKRAIAIRLRDDGYAKLIVEVQDVEAALATIHAALAALRG